MSRKKQRREKIKYLPGVTWKDVLRGKPVTPDSAAKKPVPLRSYRCRDCGGVESISTRVRAHRCLKCGGVQDPVPS